MRYFRYFPWGFQVLMFIVLVFTMYCFAFWGLNFFLPRLTGLNIDFLDSLDEHSPYYQIRTGLYIQGITSLLFFALPAFLFAYLAHPRPMQYLGLTKPGRNMQFLIVIILMLSAIPVLDFIENLMSKLPMTASMRNSQLQNEKISDAFLKMPDITALAATFIALAIIPALGEELFFRAIMMKFVKKQSKKMILPVVFTAIVFALSHTNLLGLPSIFIAGVILALIYYYTGSLWCSILGHCVFNGATVIITYFSGKNKNIETFFNNSFHAAILIIICLIVCCGSFYLLIRTKTPLSDDWSDDFRGEIPDNGIEGTQN